jgi:hypothetical protein
MRDLTRDDPTVSVWWGTPVECAAAVHRREREAPADVSKAADAIATLRALSETWLEIPPTARVRETALRLVRVHDLRAADALQLAAARVASDEQPESLPFVTLDDRLAVAARREGFPVLP